MSFGFDHFQEITHLLGMGRDDDAPQSVTRAARSLSARGEQAMSTERRLRGRTLVIVRALWGLIVLFEVGVLLFDLPAFIAVLHTACSDPTGVSCNYLQLRFAQ